MPGIKTEDFEYPANELQEHFCLKQEKVRGSDTKYINQIKLILPRGNRY